MELCDVDLFTIIKDNGPFNENEAKILMKQVFESL